MTQHALRLNVVDSVTTASVAATVVECMQTADIGESKWAYAAPSHTQGKKFIARPGDRQCDGEP